MHIAISVFLVRSEAYQSLATSLPCTVSLTVKTPLLFHPHARLSYLLHLRLFRWVQTEPRRFVRKEPISRNSSHRQSFRECVATLWTTTVNPHFETHTFQETCKSYLESPFHLLVLFTVLQVYGTSRWHSKTRMVMPEIGLMGMFCIADGLTVDHSVTVFTWYKGCMPVFTDVQSIDGCWHFDLFLCCISQITYMGGVQENCPFI